MLYNKYRPQYFRDLIGQEFSKNLLLNILKQKANIHSFLFYGPNGTGKTTAARLFARAINCDYFDESQDICGKCESCKLSREEGCTDIIEIDGATNNGVEFIREIVKGNAIYPPLLLKKKLYLIDEAHCLSLQAWNSLLKIIEEPPSHLILIFLTTEVHKIIPTILSRCQKLLFSPLEDHLLLPFLEKVSSQEKQEIQLNLLKKVIEESNGSVREALVILEKIFLNQKEKELINNLQIIENTSLELLNLIFNSKYSESLIKLSENLNNSIRIFEIILDRLLELSFYSMGSYSRELLFNLSVQEAESFLKLSPNLNSMINFLAPVMSSTTSNSLKTIQFSKFILLNLFQANLKKEIISPKGEILMNSTTSANKVIEQKQYSQTRNYSTDGPKIAPLLSETIEQKQKSSDLPNIKDMTSHNILKIVASDFPKLNFIEKLMREEEILDILNSCDKQLSKERYLILQKYLESDNSNFLLTELIKKINSKYEIICSKEGCLITFSNDFDTKLFNLKIRSPRINSLLVKLFEKSINCIGISISDLSTVVKRNNNSDNKEIKNYLAISSKKKKEELLWKNINKIFAAPLEK